LEDAAPQAKHRKILSREGAALHGAFFFPRAHLEHTHVEPASLASQLRAENDVLRHPAVVESDAPKNNGITDSSGSRAKYAGSQMPLAAVYLSGCGQVAEGPCLT